MQIKNVKITLLKVVKKEGVGKKSGKPYLFYVATVVDEESNVMQFNIADSVVSQPAKLNALLGIRNEEIVVSFKLLPKGNFDLGASIVSID